MSPFAQFLVTALLVSFMFSAGLETPAGELRAVFRRPWRLLQALVPALILIPLVIVWPALHLGLPRPVAVAVALLAVAPGAPFVARAVRKAGGSVPFAHALNLILAVVTVFTAPAIVRWVRAGDDALFIEPGRLIAELLVLQVVPLAAGIAFRHRWPETAPRLDRFVLAVFATIVLIVLAIGLSNNLRGIASLGAAGLAATAAAAAIAWFLGWRGGHDDATRRAVSLTCGIPNLGLVLAILRGADVPPLFVTAAVATWLVRLLLNQGFAAFLARHPAQPPAPHLRPPRYEPTRPEPPSAPPPA